VWTPELCAMFDDGKCWRIRLKCGGHHRNDITRLGWEESVVGIWYGAATVEEITKALELDSADAVAFLSSLPNQKALDWEQTRVDLDTIRRFFELSERDWIFTYFDDSLPFARPEQPARSDVNHKWNFGNQVFKYRSIKDKKSFALRRLPDGFRLLTTSGRGNVHRILGAERLVRILADSGDTEDARHQISKMPCREWLDILGPSSWESISLGYLILEKGFVPTGRDVGRTLPTFAIVGRDGQGNRILAQCKKNPMPAPLDENFLKIASEASGDAQFAGGGVLLGARNVISPKKPTFFFVSRECNGGHHVVPLTT
jgi:hypothetical protein